MAFVKTDADGEDVRMSLEQPVIISFPVPQAMTLVVKAESRHEDQIDFLYFYGIITGRLRDSEGAGDKIIEGFCRTKRQVVIVNLWKKKHLAFIMHEEKEVHLPLYRIIDGNNAGIPVFGKIANVIGYLDLGTLLVLRGDPLAPFQ
jgi:hypothetical protein